MGKNVPNKKTEEKKKERIVEDKTFGLKNKNKSKKVQEYIKSVEQQVFNKSIRKETEEKFKKKEEKKKQMQDAALLGFLQKAVGSGKKEEEKVEAAAVEQTEDEKTAAINIYIDPREADPLRSQKVCDHFMEACEKNVYGWRWICPNGGMKCNYTHALPEGYMLRSTMEALMKMQREDDNDTIKFKQRLEYQIEEMRAKLDPDKCTPVNKETFEAWRKKRREKFLKQKEQENNVAKEKIRGKGSKAIFLSGRALMKYDANMFKNEDEEDNEKDNEEKNIIEEEKKEEEEEILELNFGIDEEEQELEKQIEEARKMGVDAAIFDADEVDENELNELDELGDLE